MIFALTFESPDGDYICVETDMYSGSIWDAYEDEYQEVGSYLAEKAFWEAIKKCKIIAECKDDKFPVRTIELNKYL